MIGKGLMDDAMGEMGPMPSKKAPMTEDEYSPEGEHKAAFLEMCEAIRAGDDKAAWLAYQECMELG